MSVTLYLLPDAALFVVLARMVWIGAHETARREFLYLLAWFSYSVLSLSEWFPRAGHLVAWPAFCLAGAWLSRGLFAELKLAGASRTSTANAKARTRVGLAAFLILYYGGAFLGLGAAALSLVSTACWLVLAWFIGPRPDAIFNLGRLGIAWENFDELSFSWRPAGVSRRGRRENSFPVVVPPRRQASGSRAESTPTGHRWMTEMRSAKEPRSAACLPPLPKSRRSQ